MTGWWCFDDDVLEAEAKGIQQIPFQNPFDAVVQLFLEAKGNGRKLVVRAWVKLVKLARK